MSKSTPNFNDKLSDLQNKYSKSSTTLQQASPVSIEPINEPTNANLSVQMNLYDSEKINSNIVELNDIYIGQQQRLKQLQEEDPETCLENCENFLNQNNDIIESQLNTIIDLDNKIKGVVSECETIEKQEEKLNSMLSEPKYVDLAEKIKKMRGTIDNMNNFLVRKKISNHKN